MPNTEIQRSEFRLRYPRADRPRLQCRVDDFPVVELSENGLRFVAKSGFDPDADAELRGIIAFADGHHVMVTGRVLRCEGDEVVLQLATGVSLQRMFQEQRRLTAAGYLQSSAPAT